MYVFTRMIKGWQLGSPRFDASFDLETPTIRTVLQRPGDASQRSRRAVSFKVVGWFSRGLMKRDPIFQIR